MKRILLLAISVIAAVSCCQQPKTAADFPARWILSNDGNLIYESCWTGEGHYLGSMNGNAANITIVSAKGDQDKFDYRIRGKVAEVNHMTKGDYILFSIPVQNLKAGSHIELDATVISSPDSPKYFIAEILDGKQWKSVENDLRTAVEDHEVKYTFMCSGTVPEKYQHNNIYQTFRIGKTIRNGELKIRFRAVGDLACNGKSLCESGDNAWVGFAAYGFVGAYIQNLGTETPKDTTNILCLGNSFTYFSNTPSMLKEIAWSQGHYFDVSAHMKGGQSLDQHADLLLSNDAIDAQVPDYAFLQDWSNGAAFYCFDPVTNANFYEGYKRLSDKIKAKYPDCQLVYEHTWPYYKWNMHDFGSLEKFNDLLRNGANEIAKYNDAIVTHIGDAFIAVDPEKFDATLYNSDGHHQSHYGSYLKACVNYLTITGEPFKGYVPDCGIDPRRAEYLRSVAQQVVLGK